MQNVGKNYIDIALLAIHLPKNVFLKKEYYIMYVNVWVLSLGFSITNLLFGNWYFSCISKKRSLMTSSSCYLSNEKERAKKYKEVCRRKISSEFLVDHLIPSGPTNNQW